MKKMISTILIICILITYSIIPVSVSATTTDLNLVFDMDLSKCTAENPQQVEDKSGADMVESITYLHRTATGFSNNPNKVQYGVVEGKNTPYLTFADFDGTNVANANSVLHVNFKEDEISKRNFANSNAITVETWVKLDKDGQKPYPQLFAYGCNCHATINTHLAFSAQFNTTGSNDIRFYADRGITKGGNGPHSDVKPDTSCYGEWAHYTFVREWIEEKGGWDLKIYVNGEQRNTNYPIIEERINYTVPFNETATSTQNHYPTTLMIGCAEKNNYNNSFAGSIATFKMYDDVRTPEEIKRDYNTSKADFYNPIFKGISFENEQGTIIDEKSVFLKDAAEVTATAEIADCPRDIMGILALYDENDMLIGVDIASESEPDLEHNITTMTATTGASQINKAIFYLWDGLSNIRPIFTSKSIGGEPDPLKIDGKFYDGTNSEIKFMEGKTGIKSKLRLSAGEPPQNLVANLNLMRNKSAIYKASTPIVFSDGNAEVDIAYEVNAEYTPLPTMQAEDELVVTVTDGTKVLFEKRLPYEDQSNIVDVILVAGQSNALGQGGNASQSLKPMEDTVYYNTMGNKTLSTYGNQGWDSSLGKTWHEETGRKVLIVKATWGGTGFPNKIEPHTGKLYETGSDFYGLWNPDNGNPESNTGTPALGANLTPRNCYLHAKNLYDAAIASINTDQYKIGRRIYFWNQGCNENGSYTPQEYKEAFMELHNKFVTEFGDEDTSLEYGGILPVRSSILSAIVGTAEGTLKLTGPRIAQYDIAATQDNIFIVADAMERWSSDENIRTWFEEKYKDTSYYAGNANIPKAWSDIIKPGDNVHYLQYALNELGIEAARNMLAHLRGEGVVDGINIITPYGLEYVENGGVITLPSSDGDNKGVTLNGVIPVMPASSGIEGTFTLSGDTAVEFTNGLLIPKTTTKDDFSTLYVTYKENGVDKTMQFTVKTPFNTAASPAEIEIAPIYNNRSAIFTLTTDDGYKMSNQWIDAELAEIEEEKELESNTLKVTMGLVPDWMGTGKKSGVMTWEEAQDLAKGERWGVANHTMNHQQSNPAFNTLDEETLENEINGARAVLKEKFPTKKILGIYTPGGLSNNLVREIAAKEHLCLRVAGGGLNPLPLTDTVVGDNDFVSNSIYALNVPAWNTYGTEDEGKARVDKAIADNSWLIEMWHGVACAGEDLGVFAPVPEDVASAHLRYVADKAKSGELWVTTLDEAAVYATQRLHTRVSFKSETNISEGKIVFGIEDDLPDEIYDAILTINIKLPDGWTNATTTREGGSIISSSIKDGVISLNTKSNQGNIIITKE